MKRPPHPLHLVLGLSIWSAWFVAAYGGLSPACALRPPPVESDAATWVNAGLGVLTLATAVLLLWAALNCWRAGRQPAGDGAAGRRRFVAPVAAGLYLASAIATVVVGLPLMALPPCV